jgi:ATP-dependent RNA helicase UAP56/SUB2
MGKTAVFILSILN